MEKADAILEYVRDTVRDALCQRENLDPRAFVLGESRLIRCGAVCGYYFWIEGPRSVRLSAVWEFAAEALLFYGSDGARYAKSVAGFTA